MAQVGGWDRLLVHGRFSIKKMYQLMQGVFPKVSWRKLICNNQASPKSLFIAWLLVQQRLSTADVLRKWGINCDLMCVLCKAADESHTHLFFDCVFSAQVWSAVLAQLQMTRPIQSLSEEIHIAAKFSGSKQIKLRLVALCFVFSVYALWIERNYRRYTAKAQTWQQVALSN